MQGAHQVAQKLIITILFTKEDKVMDFLLKS